MGGGRVHGRVGIHGEDEDLQLALESIGLLWYGCEEGELLHAGMEERLGGELVIELITPSSNVFLPPLHTVDQNSW